MATKAYLTPEQFEEGRKRFLQDNGKSPEELSRICSRWLSDRLEERLRSIPGFEAAQPIRLGSWARGELCPKSDVDLVLIGEEKLVGPFVAGAQEAGIKIRARLPENPADWSVGVEPFDVAALFSARA